MYEVPVATWPIPQICEFAYKRIAEQRSYFRIALSRKLSPGEVKTYTDAGRYWQDALGPFFRFSATSGARQRTLGRGHMVTLENFNLSDWVPLAFGRCWVRDMDPLLEEARLAMIRFGPRNPKVYECEIRAGMKGTVRFSGHEGKYFLSAWARDSLPCSGVPVVLSESAFLVIEDILKRCAAVKVKELSGILNSVRYMDVPNGFGIPRPPNVPYLAIVVDNPHLVKGCDYPEEVGVAHAWTVFRCDGEEHWVCKPFSIGAYDWEDKLKDALDGIKDVLEIKQARPDFDFDEQVPRLSDAKTLLSKFFGGEDPNMRIV